MNFPLDNPIFQFLFWLIDTAFVGGFFALLVGGGSVLAYGIMLRWIIHQERTDREETFTYPTPAFHHGHGEADVGR